MKRSIFSLLNEQQKTQLFEMGKPMKVTAGTLLFQLGEEATHMYRVEKGKVSLFRLMPNGDEKLFNVFLAGQVIAEMAMFMVPRHYPMSARVDQDSELTAFFHEDVLQVVIQSPEASRNVFAFMSNKIAGLMDTIDILTQVNANQRLVMKLAEMYRTQPDHKGKITLSVTKKHLAMQLGMTPETLSRTIKKLKDDGYITEVANHIVLVDLPGLCRSAGLGIDIFELRSG